MQTRYPPRRVFDEPVNGEYGVRLSNIWFGEDPPTDTSKLWAETDRYNQSLTENIINYATYRDVINTENYYDDNYYIVSNFVTKRSDKNCFLYLKNSELHFVYGNDNIISSEYVSSCIILNVIDISDFMIITFRLKINDIYYMASINIVGDNYIMSELTPASDVEQQCNIVSRIFNNAENIYLKAPGLFGNTAYLMDYEGNTIGTFNDDEVLYYLPSVPNYDYIPIMLVCYEDRFEMYNYQGLIASFNISSKIKPKILDKYLKTTFSLQNGNTYETVNTYVSGTPMNVYNIEFTYEGEMLININYDIKYYPNIESNIDEIAFNRNYGYYISPNSNVYPKEIDNGVNFIESFPTSSDYRVNLGEDIVDAYVHCDFFINKIRTPLRRCVNGEWKLLNSYALDE